MRMHHAGFNGNMTEPTFRLYCNLSSRPPWLPLRDLRALRGEIPTTSKQAKGAENSTSRIV